MMLYLKVRSSFYQARLGTNIYGNQAPKKRPMMMRFRRHLQTLDWPAAAPAAATSSTSLALAEGFNTCEQVRKRLLCPVLCTENLNICQDRLGTSTGKVKQK